MESFCVAKGKNMGDAAQASVKDRAENSTNDAAQSSANKELFAGAFFDELVAWGVSAVVVSPGSRSTPLSMVAYEYARRFPEKLKLYVDIDERGAAFFALGMAKATASPVAVICTSGSAVANYYPAVMEAEAARVPLVVLTGDRPLALQGFGAPQTCDQVNAFGNHVKAFRQMPEPAADKASLRFARQAAREACVQAIGEGVFTCAAQDDLIAGACEGGPVHINFPFAEPLTPTLTHDNLFSEERSNYQGVREVQPRASLGMQDASYLAKMFQHKKVLVVAGEQTCTTIVQAEKILSWAQAYRFPVVSDVLSGLRSIDIPEVIDSYDSFLKPGGVLPDELVPDMVIRLGRFPVSKKATQLFGEYQPLQVVVDFEATRDFTHTTDMFIRCSAVEFASSLRVARELGTISVETTAEQGEFCHAWIAENNRVNQELAAVEGESPTFEGAYLHRLLQLIPAQSCLFTANSMSVRALDTFYGKEAPELTVLCNRGLNGIDGVVSTAFGAAQAYRHTVFITGDLTFLHDINALHLQNEMMLQKAQGNACPNIVIVLFNNNGGGIFDILAQKSADAYYERLFTTPHHTDFQQVAQGFGVPAHRVQTLEEFEGAYSMCQKQPGVNLIEVATTCEGVQERYAPYWNK